MVELSLFERVGGRIAIHRLANHFYDIMQADVSCQTILGMHPQDLKHSRERLENYLCEWLGGPKLYGEQYVKSNWIKRRHQHLAIGFSERDQWLYCMRLAIQELDLDEQLQFELNKLFFN